MYRSGYRNTGGGGGSAGNEVLTDLLTKEGPYLQAQY